jgi:exopolyphosphatase/pppGpp-phosphohydrolase
MNVFDLAPDRADVIVPACEIFIQVAKAAGVSKFIVPTRGLVDGMVRTMITRPQERASTSERRVDPPLTPASTKAVMNVGKNLTMNRSEVTERE